MALSAPGSSMCSDRSFSATRPQEPTCLPGVAHNLTAPSWLAPESCLRLPRGLRGTARPTALHWQGGTAAQGVWRRADVVLSDAVQLEGGVADHCAPCRQYWPLTSSEPAAGAMTQQGAREWRFALQPTLRSVRGGAAGWSFRVDVQLTVEVEDHSTACSRRCSNTSGGGAAGPLSA